MPEIRELSSAQKFWEVVRWLLVLPAAVVVQLIVRLVLGILLQCGLGLLSGSTLDKAFSTFSSVLVHSVPACASLLAGVYTAPYYRRAVSLALLGLLGSVSLFQHLVGPQLAGHRVGVVNFSHVVQEMAGLVAGLILIRWRTNLPRQRVASES